MARITGHQRGRRSRRGLGGNQNGLQKLLARDGRRDVRAFSAAREPRVRALGGSPDARVNTAWDSWFLKQLVAADLDPVIELGDELQLQVVFGP